MNRRESTVKRALTNFFRTTTLHGFKYLCSDFFLDRVGWVLCCCASTCCAGVLCAVLWARFLQMPAVLQLKVVRDNFTLMHHMPEQVAVCPPILGLTSLFLKQLNITSSMNIRLSRTIENILVGKPATKDQVQLLEKLLTDQNMTLTGMMLKYSPTCERLIVNCMWQRAMVSCKALFEKELTNSGICCVMRPHKANNRLLDESHRPNPRFGQVRTLDLSLQCSNETNHGCKFFAKYKDESNLQTTVLTPGYIYFATILYSSVPMSSTKEFIESNCVSDNSYSKETCLVKCAEKFCGCSDSLPDIEIEEGNILPSCSIRQSACLRAYEYQNNVTCKCLPSCNKITSDISLESTIMNLETFTIDPVYNGLNNKSTVLHIRVNIPLSKTFTLIPTETWFTLLSSLGGVFNMFLGVGLFSALEILFLLLLKLPIAILKSPFH